MFKRRRDPPSVEAKPMLQELYAPDVVTKGTERMNVAVASEISQQRLL